MLSNFLDAFSFIKNGFHSIILYLDNQPTLLEINAKCYRRECKMHYEICKSKFIVYIIAVILKLMFGLETDIQFNTEIKV